MPSSRSLAALIILFCIIVTSVAASFNTLKEYEEEVIIYNTYGYSDGDQWVIPMRLYVVDERNYVESFLTGLFGRVKNLSPNEKAIFRSRIGDFVTDSESNEEVVFVFDDDPENKEFQVMNENGYHPRSNINGVIEGHIKLSKNRASELLQAQNSDSGWLTIHVVSDGHLGSGNIQLIGPNGLSVISDIDDTIKNTGMPMDRDYIIQKTFFEDYSAASGMTELYHNWDDAAFHYVSGTPWQFYRPLTGFLFSEDIGFPKGTFHMKFVPKNLLSLTTWINLYDLMIHDGFTYQQKLGQIIEIIEKFPNRDFILVGDSGEQDPEIYTEICHRYAEQIQGVYIRDVINDRYQNPERLDGMHIIPAPVFERESL